MLNQYIKCEFYECIDCMIYVKKKHIFLIYTKLISFFLFYNKNL